jgi:hypothetical protein
MSYIITGTDSAGAVSLKRGSAAAAIKKAAERVIDLAGIGLGVGDEFRNGIGGKGWIHFHRVSGACHAGDWGDVADEIEIELVVKRRVDGVRDIDQEEGIAVRGRAHGRLGGDIAASPWPVIDDELLAEPLRQPLSHQACWNVGRTTCSTRNDQANRPPRIGLRLCDPRYGREGGSPRYQMQKSAAQKFWCIYPEQMDLQHGCLDWTTLRPPALRDYLNSALATLPDAHEPLLRAIGRTQRKYTDCLRA